MVKAETGRRAVFLDRDGTINEERDYLWRVEDFVFIPGAPEAIRLLREAGFLVVVVTNQSGIGRGYYDEAALERLHAHMAAELAKAGAGVDAAYFCPHHPRHGQGEYGRECACRKPLPGMLLSAASDLGIDLAGSWVVGDKLSDIEAGQAAGCRSLLVRTGYGAAEAAAAPPEVPVYADLLAAARAIVAGEPAGGKV
jgi:D-glycero-D-manno-heptose 1,7-bisphosphate phosphatase